MMCIPKNRIVLHKLIKLLNLLKIWIEIDMVVEKPSFDFKISIAPLLNKITGNNLILDRAINNTLVTFHD